MNTKVTVAIVVSLVLLLSTSNSVLAQASPRRQLTHANEMVKEGKTAEAIVNLQSLLDSNTLDARGTGKAWNILGLAYEDQGNAQLARHAYEESLRILKPLPDSRDYAMALDDLGRIYLATRQFDVAEKIRKKALNLYQQIGDDDGLTRALTDLAAISFHEKKVNQGSRYLDRAVDEAREAKNLDDDDRAAIASLQGWKAQFDRDYTLSIVKYQQSLELWRNLHGEEHPYTGWGYLLLGDAEADAGQLVLAEKEIRQSIAILGRALGQQNPRYLLAELAYARVLDAAGSHREAALIKSVAEPQLEDIDRRQCAGCTISALAFP